MWLASEHGAVAPYGGKLAKYGFWFLSLCVGTRAVIGVVAIRNGNPAGHRIWMIRFAGSMWGAFRIFRFLIVVTGPLLRNRESVSLLISIGLSIQLGIVIAGVMRRKWERRPVSSVRAPEPVRQGCFGWRLFNVPERLEVIESAMLL